MKKTLFVCALLFATVQVTKAQLNNITSSVTNEKGTPLHDVFVADDQYKNATFTDSLGGFTIAVHPDSKLRFEHAGYKDTLITAVKPGADMSVTLKSTAGSVASADNPTGRAASEGLSKNEVAVISNDMGGYLKPAHEKGDTRGSQYLCETFVHGYMISSAGELVHNPSFLFDYDKIGGRLLLTRDNKLITEVGWDQINSFTLFSNTDERFDFEKAPAIDPSHYVQVLASGTKYKIYKLIKTRFAKADYVNNGAAAHGHDYDEYIDDADYYVFDPQTNQPKKFSLRKKSIKEAFAKEADKINKYLSDNPGDIDDAYLSKLGVYMNQ
jgi:hypothetical protein